MYQRIKWFEFQFSLTAIKNCSPSPNPLVLQNNMNKRLYSDYGILIHLQPQNPLPALSESLVGNLDVKRERLMNLHGSIIEIQNTIAHRYLQLEHRFKENGLIRELWASMANDLSQQINSLKALSPSFWNHLKGDPDKTLETAVQSVSHQTIGEIEDLPLKGYFEFALMLEEPTILKIYAPIIRSLRENYTDKALDFYIMVKAHLARIVRVTQSFSGDPIVIHRANLLLQNFEKEVQEPQLKAKPVQARKTPSAKPVQAKKPIAKSAKASKSAHPLAKHNKMHHSPKALVKKVELSRRRARR